MKIKNLTILFLIIFMFVLFFANAEIVSKSVISSLNFSFSSLVSSLFPYMVLCGIITESGCIDSIVYRIDERIFYKLGICKKYIVSIILGCICGFVVGARGICETYKKDGCLYDGFSDSIILTSNAGVGFVIGCVGYKIWGDIYFGIFLYIIQILSALALHMIFKESISCKNLNSKFHNRKSISYAISSSISSSCTTMLSIIAFVVFYSILIDVLTSFFNIQPGGFLYNALYSVLEFGRGSFASATCISIPASAFLCGFCIGFGGLCVFSQISYVCDTLAFNRKKYILIKFLQGIICGVFSAIYIRLKNVIPKIQGNIDVFAAKSLNFISMSFIIACSFIFLRKMHKNL